LSTLAASVIHTRRKPPHMCREFVRQRKLARTHTVAGHKQPTGEACFGCMETVNINADRRRYVYGGNDRRRCAIPVIWTNCSKQSVGSSPTPGDRQSAPDGSSSRGPGKRQVDLVLLIGADLSRLVRNFWIELALRAAHLPAHVAGFGVLQDFLERGFTAFRKLRNPSACWPSSGTGKPGECGHSRAAATVRSTSK